jgi:hypothetical protein
LDNPELELDVAIEDRLDFESSGDVIAVADADVAIVLLEKEVIESSEATL